jgi:hypothetical protein
MDEPRATTSVVIGLTSLARATWLAELAARLAHLWAMMGHTVALIDGDPWGEPPPGWAADEAVGRPLADLLSGAIIGVDTAVASAALSAALGEAEPPGALGLMTARGEDAPPALPRARSVVFARSALRNALVGRRRADVVIVRLPPLGELVGQALGANLVDVMVPILSPLELLNARTPLDHCAALQEEPRPIFPVELARRPLDPSLWLAHVGRAPAAQLKVSAQDDEDSIHELVGALSDALRPAVGLTHPDPAEATLEADALDQGPGAYLGFRRLLRQDREEAMRFFRDVLAGRGATVRSAVEALRAMDDERLPPELLAYGLRYVVQKFRVAEPDELSEVVLALGRRLLALARAGGLAERATRVKIDVAMAMLNYGFYLKEAGAYDHGLTREANRLLLEAAAELETAPLPGALQRLAKGFARHGLLCEDNRNADLALNLITLAEQRGLPHLSARQATIDALWMFCEAEPTAPLLRLTIRLANELLPLDPSYAHYALMGLWEIAGDKVRATDHFFQLVVIDPARARMAMEDSWLRHYFQGVATTRFFRSTRKKGFKLSELL